MDNINEQFCEIKKLTNYAFFQIPITLQKEISLDHEGHEVSKCGFKIGGIILLLWPSFNNIELLIFFLLAGGIDQDFTKSPQGIRCDNME